MVPFDRFLCIDYGSSSIKGVLFQYVLGKLEIIRKESLSTVHLDGNFKEEYEYNLVRFIQSFFPEESQVLISLDPRRIFTRNINIPITSEKAIKEVLPFEVEPFLPFPLESMEVKGLKWRANAESTDLITFSIEKKAIEEALSPFSNSSVILRTLTVPQLALSTLVPNVENNVTVLLDMGGENTLLSILTSGNMSYARSLGIGTEYIFKRFLSLLKIEEFMVREIINSLPENESSWNEYFRFQKISEKLFPELAKIIQQFKSEIVGEVEKSILGFSDVLEPNEFYLSGGGSRLPGLLQSLRDALNLPGSYLPTKELEDQRYGVAFGLGVAFVKGFTKKIDFLDTPTGKLFNQNSFSLSSFKKHFIIAGISIVLLMSVFFLQILYDNIKLRENYKDLRKKYVSGFGEDPGPDLDVLQLANQKLLAEQKRTEIFRLFLSQESVLDLLLSITEHFPPKEDFPFILDSFIFEGNQIEINGKVNEFSDIGRIESDLAKSDKVTNIKTSDKRLNTSAQKFKVSFRIRMDVVTPKENK